MDSVVADVGVGHGHDLALVRGIGQDLLVAGHAGVEDHLASRLTARAEGPSVEDLAILQSQYRPVMHSLPPFLSNYRTAKTSAITVIAW
jgi:hypothetical protein